MSHNKITILTHLFTDDDIEQGNCYIGNSIVGDELSVDTLNAVVRSPGVNLSALPYGTPVLYHHDDILIGKFYLHDIGRVGREKYALNCVSGVGLLDTPMHYGGLYTGETALEVLTDIIGGIVPFSVAQAVGAVRVYGWLPVDTRRANLRQLLFALGAALKKDVAGDISIVLLDLADPREIIDDRLGRGGSVEYLAAVSDVVVLEHGYIVTASDEESTLYEDAVVGQELISPMGAAMTGVLVTFNGPMHDLSAVGGEILESGVNYAVLAPSGQTTLTGRAYTHTTREVHAVPESASGEKNVARVEGATLVNLTNSEAVAGRVAAYYSASRTIHVDMVVGAERPGDPVTLLDPFGDRVVALLMSQDINLSNLLTAQAQMIAGYTPDHGDIYEHVVLLTGEGVWTPPEGVKRIRAVLIGGGFGGGSGNRGEDASDGGIVSSTTQQSYDTTTYRGYGLGKPGAGGASGIPGLGGRIRQATIALEGGESFSYKCGTGGSGGVYAEDGPAGGAEGGATIFGALTSSDGTPSEYGFTDIITGEVYGGRGDAGISGGRGNGWDGVSEASDLVITPGDTVTDKDGNAWTPGTDLTTRAEAEDNLYNADGYWVAEAKSGSSSSCGGGAAVGANGGAAESLGGVSASCVKSTGDCRMYASGGRGGKGGDAMPPEKQTKFGYGGHGGNGGGGGGGGPANWARLRKSTQYTGVGSVTWGYYRSDPGLGGAGSNGGEGGDGCVLVYY